MERGARLGRVSPSPREERVGRGTGRGESLFVFHSGWSHRTCHPRGSADPGSNMPILKGWNLSAQGCEERATLGQGSRIQSTRNGLNQRGRIGFAIVRARAGLQPKVEGVLARFDGREIDTTLSELIALIRRPTQGSSFLAALY